MILPVLMNDYYVVSGHVRESSISSLVKNRQYDDGIAPLSSTCCSIYASAPRHTELLLIML